MSTFASASGEFISCNGTKFPTCFAVNTTNTGKYGDAVYLKKGVASAFITHLFYTVIGIIYYYGEDIITPDEVY